MIRMKKVISIGTVLVMLLSLCACGRTEKATSSDEYMVHSRTETSSDADVDSYQTTVTAGQSDEDASLSIEDSSAPVVFFTSDISAEGLARLYEKLIWEPTGNLAVKVSTGEPPASNYLRQELIGEQAALQSYMRSVSASISMAALNARLADYVGSGTSSLAGYDDTSMIGLMKQMVSLLAEGKEIYLDSGVLVGGTSSAMSHDLAMKARRKRS